MRALPGGNCKIRRTLRFHASAFMGSACGSQSCRQKVAFGSLGKIERESSRLELALELLLAVAEGDDAPSTRSGRAGPDDPSAAPAASVERSTCPRWTRRRRELDSGHAALTCGGDLARGG